jgi:AraC-like DNA-binding protein
MEALPRVKDATDPLSEALSLLELENAQCSRLEASGSWALSFVSRTRVKIVALLRGTCWIIVPDATPHRLTAGDTFLLTTTSYIIASDIDVPPTDGAAIFDAEPSHVVRLGGADTALVGGAFVFGGENGLITETLPPFLRISGAEPAGAGLRESLKMLDRELDSGLMGSTLMTRRLAEMLLLQAFRAYVAGHGAEAAGWIGALSDARVGRAIALMHENVGHGWTVAELASAVGMSRSAFALRFKAMVGVAPLEYLRRWRMLRARHALRRDSCSIFTLARTLGYASESAFGNAFKSTFGHSPRQSRSSA